MKTFKKLRLLSYLVLGLSVLTFSCKKDKDAPIGIIGTSVGTYDYTGDNIPFSLSLTVNADNTVQAIIFNAASQLNVNGSGTYTLSASNIFDAAITTAGVFQPLSFTGTFNPSTGTMVGTWGYSPSKTNGGTWTTTKQ
jgi:hypothetical protein